MESDSFTWDFLEIKAEKYSTLEIPYNEKLEHRRPLCIERERDPLHILLIAMSCYAHYMTRAVILSVMPSE